MDSLGYLEEAVDLALEYSYEYSSEDLTTLFSISITLQTEGVRLGGILLTPADGPISVNKIVAFSTIRHAMVNPLTNMMETIRKELNPLAF